MHNPGGSPLSHISPLVLICVTLLATMTPAALAADLGEPWAPGSSVWNVPGDIPEMMAATRDMPALYSFGRNGYAAIECGYQAILLGSKIPIGPGPHIPWAKPYARGPLRILAIGMFGNSPADARQVAQVARELDCDLRFVLIADTITHTDWGHDEAYRLGFLAEQAREALREDYDVILLAMGSYSPGFGYPQHRNSFPDDVYHKILEKAERGTGLVFVGSNLGGWWVERTPLLEASPATMTGARRVAEPEVKPGPDSDLLLGSPVQRVPRGVTPPYPFAVYNWELREGAQVAATESDQPLVILGQHGRGRTVLLGWDGTLTPGRATSGDRPLFEHQMAVVLRAITWAGGKEPPVQVVPQSGELAAGQRGELTVQLDGPAELHCTVRDPEFRTWHEGRTRAQAGDNRVAVGALPAGEYWLDVIARDGRGASLGWGSAPFTVSSNDELTLQTDREAYRVGDTVEITGTAPAGPNRRVEIEVADAQGRVLARSTAPDVARFAASYPVADARVPLHEITATLYEGRNPLLVARQEFFVPVTSWDDYHNVLWPAHLAEMSREAREVCGLTGVMDSWGTSSFGRHGAKVGILPFRMNDGVLGPAGVQLAPDDLQNEEPFTRALEAARLYGCIGWAMQDERHAMSDPGMPNEEGLRRYREYLQRQYRTLEALNASWETNHASWEEILPTLTEALTPETRNLAPWVDFRLYVTEQVYQIDRSRVERIREVLGRDAKVGIDGFTTSGHMIPYGSTDIGRYLEEGVFNFYCPYGDDLLIASLNQGPTVKYIGWGQSRNEYFGNPWRDAFRGHWGTFRFFGPTFFSEFGWVQPAGAWIEEGTRELRQGVGKALMGAQRELAPVAILYSYPSMMASAAAGVWVEPGNAHVMWRPANWSRETFEKMLQQSGVSFGYVTTDQVERGALADKKLLILPHFMSVALSDETCAAIKQFVADGGMVVSDMAPAVLDEHGKPRAQGGLDDLFGVSREKLVYGQRYPDYLVGIVQEDPLVPRQGWWIGQWLEEELTVTDGQALGQHWFIEAPAFIVKDTGKGRALLLNFLHTTAVKRNGEPEDDELQLMQHLLRASGITAPATVETDYGVAQPRHYELNLLRDGDTDYLGVYCFTTPQEPERMVVRFPTARDTYDVRQGRYLGKVAEAPLPIRAYGAALFAQLDYEVKGMAVTAGDAQRGEPVPLSLTLDAEQRPGRHVVWLQIISPDGKVSHDYSRNVEFSRGRWRGTIHTALNDPSGQWTVRAREAISGKTATAQFRLR